MLSNLFIAITSVVTLFYFLIQNPAEKKTVRFTPIKALEKTEETLRLPSQSTEIDKGKRGGNKSDSECLPHQVNQQYVQEMTKILEKKRPSEDPVAKFGKWLAALDSTRDCKGLPCHYNEIYGDKSGITGDLFYWFYLQTGYFVSANHTTTADMYIFPEETLKNFLYQEGEVREFWSVGNNLPQEMKFLSTLQTLHRGPVKHNYVLVNKEGKKLEFAALANSGGTVLFLNNCLQLKRSWEEEEIEDYGSRMNECFLHEIGHHFDYTLGGLPYKDNRPSGKDDWLALSDWKIVEERQPGVIIRRWTVGKDANFFTPYAGTQPGEDFAESIMAFRQKPDKAIEKIPTKVKFLKEKFFNNRGFTTEERKSYYLTQVQKQSKESIPQIVMDCLLQSKDDKKQWKICTDNKFNEGFNQSISLLKKTEWEACQDFKDKNLIPNMKLQAEKKFEEEKQVYLDTHPEQGEVLLQSEKLRQLLDKEFDPRAVFMFCQEGDGEACYKKTVLEQVSYLAHQHFPDLMPEVIRYESNLYLEKNQFSTIKKKTEVEIDLFLASKNATLWPPVKETFDQCLATSIQELDPKNVVMTPFHGGEQFIRLEIIQCVNQKIEEVVRKQISEVLGENDQTQYDTYVYDYIKQRAMPFFLQLLTDYVAGLALDEQKTVFEKGVEIYKMLEEKMEWPSDLDNAQQPIDSKIKIEKCMAYNQSKIEELSKDLTLNFHSLKKFKDGQLKKACLKTLLQRKPPNSGEVKAPQHSESLQFSWKMKTFFSDLMKSTVQDSQDFIAVIVQCRSPQLDQTDKCVREKSGELFQRLFSDSKIGKEQFEKEKSNFVNQLMSNEVQKNLLQKWEEWKKQNSKVSQAVANDFQICINDKYRPLTVVNSVLTTVFPKDFGPNQFFYSCLEYKTGFYSPLEKSAYIELMREEITKQKALRTQWPHKERWDWTWNHLVQKGIYELKLTKCKTKNDCLWKHGSKLGLTLKQYHKETWEAAWFTQASVEKAIDDGKPIIVNRYLKEL